MAPWYRGKVKGVGRNRFTLPGSAAPVAKIAPKAEPRVMPAWAADEILHCKRVIDRATPNTATEPRLAQYFGADGGAAGMAVSAFPPSP